MFGSSQRAREILHPSGMLWGVLLLLASCASPPKVAPPPNLLLITIDTLRADHLSSYGYPRPTSPVLDALAAEGTRFEHAIVQWPKTGPSFASIFTATYPKDNGIVRKVGTPVPGSYRMLAEELQELGYTTHAIVSNGAVAAELGYGQGFETYIELWKENVDTEDPLRHTRAEVVTSRALEVVARMDRTRPYFLWVHYLDPHFPYTPPEEHLEAFLNDALYTADPKLAVSQEDRRQQVGGIGHAQVLEGREDLGYYVAAYDAEIAHADAKIGEFFEAMRGEGLLANTLTVVSSDHGESLGEHDYYFDHGRFSFSTCLRVPLIVHQPGVVLAQVDAEPVELVHLAPTLLEAAGAELGDGAWMQGRSLLPRLRGEVTVAEGDTYAFAEAGYAVKRKWQKVVRDRRFKLIFVEDWADQRQIEARGTRFVLYDLDVDPGETSNVAEHHPEDLRRLKRALHTWWTAEPFEVVRDGAVAEDASEMADETREQLRALGYLD